MSSISADQIAATPTRSSQRMSAKALALVAAETSKDVTAGQKRVAAKTTERDDVPAFAGNFQDRDEIKIKVSCNNVFHNTNIRQVKQHKGKRLEKNKDSNTSNAGICTVCAVYLRATDTALISSNKDTDAGTGEGRDETESSAKNARSHDGRSDLLQLPSGCM